jgi:capsule polysaccharide export protein KpsE/RkpR
MHVHDKLKLQKTKVAYFGKVIKLNEELNFLSKQLVTANYAGDSNENIITIREKMQLIRNELSIERKRINCTSQDIKPKGGAEA